MAESKMPDELAELRSENQNLKRQLAERERQLQERNQLIEAIEALPDGLALFDPDERLILCNANYRNLHPVISDVMVPGVSIEDILQAAADRGQQRVPDGNVEEWKAGRLAAFRNPGDPIEQQFSDGSWRRVYERKTADGYTAAVRIDITELKAREHALGRIEQRLRDYLDASSDWIWEMDSHCRFSYLSGEFEKHTGVPPDALIGKTPEESGLPNVDPERWDNHLSDLEARRAFRDFRYSRMLPNGDQVQLSISGNALFDSDGRFLGYRGIGRNVTEQVSAEIRAKHAEALLENAVERLSETFALWGPNDRLVLCNRMFRAFNATVIDHTRPGTTLEKFYRAGAEKGLFPEAEGREEAWLADRLRSVRNPGKPFEVQRQDGRWLQVNDQKLPDGSLVTVGTDITDRKKAAAALQAAHDELEDRVDQRTAELNRVNADMVCAQRKAVEKSTLLQNVVDAIPAHITVRDAEGRFSFANRYLTERLGVPQDTVIDKTATELSPERGGAVIDELGRQVRESGEPVLDYEWRMPTPEGRVLLVNIVPMFGLEGSFSGTVGIGIDISDRKKLEEQLQQSQKMEAIGQLTGGVSHDFNNLLGVIIGNLDILEEQLAADGGEASEEYRSLVRAAVSASEKGAKLNKQLLAFSRRQTLAPKSIDLNEQISGMVDLLRRTLGETIEVEVVTEASLSLCDADPAQVEAALLNLAINARDAMPDGGNLSIELSNQELRERDVVNLNDVAPGDYVMLAVRDTGTGIASEDLEHVFEPFFTTKDVGQGSGLGLSMVFGFAKQSDGHVAIESREGAGTTVRIYLPRATGAVAETDREDRVLVPSRGEKILVVEDDKDMKTLTVAMLKELGYKVVEANDGASAFSVLKDETQIDVLLTDVVLPGGRDGRAIAGEAAKRFPDIKILFMSGYPKDAITSQGRLESDVLLLEKPFRKNLLARRLREAIDR